MSPFIVYPAIDLRHGQVVRLQEGDPARQTNYDPDPETAARRWLNLGAKFLHVVNLDGAFGEHSEANRSALITLIQDCPRIFCPGAVWWGSAFFGRHR